MAVDLEFLLLQAGIVQRLGELVEILLGRLRQLVGVEFEIDEKIEFRRGARRRRLRAIGGGAKADRPGLAHRRLGEEIRHLVGLVGRIGVGGSDGERRRDQQAGHETQGDAQTCAHVNASYWWARAAARALKYYVPRPSFRQELQGYGRGFRCQS